MVYCLSSDINKISKEYALRVLAYLGFLPLSSVVLLGVALQNVLNLIFKHRKLLLKKSICVVLRIISIVPRSIRMSNVGEFS